MPEADRKLVWWGSVARLVLPESFRETPTTIPILEGDGFSPTPGQHSDVLLGVEQRDERILKYVFPTRTTDVAIKLNPQLKVTCPTDNFRPS